MNAASESPRKGFSSSRRFEIHSLCIAVPTPEVFRLQEKAPGESLCRGPQQRDPAEGPSRGPVQPHHSSAGEAQTTAVR
ncbi:unnamed protein product [Lampetra planeri]